MNPKKVYKRTIRVDGSVKRIIERNFHEVCQRTGLRLSYGRIARAFWSTLARRENRALQKKCMKLVCKMILKENLDKITLYERRKRRKKRS